MNQKGLLTAWNDAKGFGFITPEGGGERVFAHISCYAGRGCCAGFFSLLAGLFHRGYLSVSILAAYGGVSLVLFVMYWIDKRAAQRGAQRTAEKTLHLFELCCGWPGALMANLGALGWLLVAPEAMSWRHH